MMPETVEKIRAAVRTRPAGLPVKLYLNAVMARRFEAETAMLHLHRDQLVSQIVEAWLVGRKSRTV
jgi:hypothetical protein